MKNKPNKITEVRHLLAEAEHIDHDTEHDGVDRRGFLKCMAWAGTGMLWTVSGGVLASKILSPTIAGAAESAAGRNHGDFSFVQISDSHIGFNKPANTDVVGTLRQAIAKINALPTPPDFILHTGDLSHLSEAAEFDTLDQLLKTAKAGKRFLCARRARCDQRQRQRISRAFWQRHQGQRAGSASIQRGVHFIGLVNVMNIAEGGLGILGEDQLAWLKEDVGRTFQQHPDRGVCPCAIVVNLSAMGLGHIKDAEQALGYLKRFRFRHGAQRPHPSDLQKS